MKKNLIEHNRKVYNKIATHFSNTRTTVWDDLLPLGKYSKPGDKILDVGCGNGRLYHLFEKKQGVSYIGIDQSNALIKIAKKQAPKGKFVLGEMTKLPFKKGEFDIVYCIAAFHHLPDEKFRLKALKEMKRVVKSGRYVILSNWNLDSHGAKKKWGAGNSERDFMIPWKNPQGGLVGERYYHAFTVEELDHLCKKAGLIIEEQYYTHKGRKGGVTATGNIITILKKPRLSRKAG